MNAPDVSTTSFHSNRSHHPRAHAAFCVCLFASAMEVQTLRAGCVSASSGLIAWWRAENNALDAVGANHATLVNGVTFSTGHVGIAFSLDGTNDFVQVPHSSALNTPNGITVEGWVRVTGTNAWNVIASKYDTSTAQVSWALLTRADGLLRFSVFESANPTRLQFADSAPGAVVPGLANHVVGSFDPSRPGLTQVRLFVNGVEMVATAGSGSVELASVAPSTTPVRLGAIQNQSGALGDFFQGTLDEISIYNRPLTPGEIQSLHLAGTEGKCIKPALRIAALPGAVRLTWTTNATGYLLETNSSPALLAGWGVLTSDYSIIETNYIVTDTLGGATRFYRLHKP